MKMSTSTLRVGRGLTLIWCIISVAFVLTAYAALAQAEPTSVTEIRHPNGTPLKRIAASELSGSCFLLGFFEDERPEDYVDVALSGGWTSVLSEFNNDEAHFMALCLGNEPPRAHVWYESLVDDNGHFVASGPQFPPSWRIGDEGTLCVGSDDEATCAVPWLHADSGLMYLSFVLQESNRAGEDDAVGGTHWLRIHSDSDTLVYDNIEATLNAVAQ